MNIFKKFTLEMFNCMHFARKKDLNWLFIDLFSACYAFQLIYFFQSHSLIFKAMTCSSHMNNYNGTSDEHYSIHVALTYLYKSFGQSWEWMSRSKSTHSYQQSLHRSVHTLLYHPNTHHSPHIGSGQHSAWIQPYKCKSNFLECWDMFADSTPRQWGTHWCLQ